MKEERNIGVWLPLSLSVMLALGMILGYTLNEQEEFPFIQKVKDDVEKIATFGQVEELIRFVESRYVDSVDRNELVEAGINEILTKLDPHSIYISPEQLNRINSEMKGSFQGIGVEVYYIEDTVNIIRVLPGGAAEKAGLKPFDQIISVNDSVVAGNPELAYDDIRKMLRGDNGLDLNLEIKRIHIPEHISIDLTVGDVDINSVDAGFSIDEKTGYIRINKFSSTTYKEFMMHYEDLVEGGVEDIIIDLRNNPGGYLPEATNILSQLFGNEKRMLVYTEGRNDKRQEYKSTGKAFFPVDDIAILIDENSASGSEIIAGAIQDWDRGIIIGRRSFGKGLVQEQYRLSNGGAIRLTVARYYTPVGRSIQRTYDDYDAYYHDFHDRYESGELFQNDTIVHQDTQVFKTKILKREVHGGGGITPDVFVPADSLYYDPVFVEILSTIPRMTFEYLKKNENASERATVAAIFEQLELSHELSEEMRDALKKDISLTYTNQVKGDAEMFKQQFLQSEEFKLAMDYFDGSISL